MKTQAAEDLTLRARAQRLLTLRRLRSQSIVLAVCLWTVAAVDFATPGIFDRAGNLKFQDFLPFYVSARLVAQHRADALYDPESATREMIRIIGRPTAIRVPYLYGPQVAGLFSPFSRLSFFVAAGIWAGVSLLIYFACVYLVWRRCPAISSHPGVVALAALAFPPVFHFFVRAQISALPLACFTAAFLAFRTKRDWLAGAALGCLLFKPQFLAAIPLVLLLARAWRPLMGLMFSAFAQLFVTRIYFGATITRAYFDMLLHADRWIRNAELGLAPIQMHSLRAFWTLVVPWGEASLALYVFSSIAVIAITASVWKSCSPLAIRFSALTLAAVLVNPHLFVYDLIVLAPALLLLLDWWFSTTKHDGQSMFPLLVYLAFILPLVGPLSRWTHLQLSVLAFAVLLWSLYGEGRVQPAPQI